MNQLGLIYEEKITLQIKNLVRTAFESLCAEFHIAPIKEKFLVEQ
jgi:hypothetical protein